MDLPVGVIVMFVLLVASLGGIGWYYVRLITKPKTLKAIEKDLDAKNYDAAIRKLQGLIQKNPNDYEAHRMLAKAYQLAGNAKMAIVEYRFAERNVDNQAAAYEIEIRTQLGRLLFHTGEFREALEEFILLNKLDAKHFESYHMAGKCYVKVGSYERAIQNFRLALKINPALHEAYYDLGLALYEAQNQTEALGEFINAIKHNPKNYMGHYYIGIIYRQLSDYVKAIEFLDVAEREKEIQVQCLLNKGICYLNLGNLPKVIEELTRGLKVHPFADNTAHLMRYHLAEAYELRKEIAPAIEQWERIFTQNPKFRDVGSKLDQYKDVRASDVLKDFMSSPATQFQALCCRAVEAMGLMVVEQRLISNDEIWVTARETSKMVGKTLLKLVIFTRQSDPVDEETVRKTLDTMKTMGCHITIYFSNTGYSRNAKEFASTRPFEIYDAKKINDLLAGA